MPRDGSNVYHYPSGIEGIPDQVIESAGYNSFLSDVEQDLNLPRPVVSGGTGASNTSDAMDALGGEVSKILVTNYDSHPFKAGSFYSDIGATNAPVTGHAFAGVCYSAVIGTVATSDMFIEARDRDDFAVPPTVYVRQKKNNVWSSWMVPAVGGSNPSFSGTIFLNGAPILGQGTLSTGVGTQLLNPTNALAIKAGVAVQAQLTTYCNDVHAFKNFDGAPQYVQFDIDSASFSVPINAGFITCTAPALDDNTSRVPTAAWVQSNLAAKVMYLPQRIVTTSTGINVTDVGKHLYHPATATGQMTLTLADNANTAARIGDIVTIVNMGSPMTIAPAPANCTFYLAGTSSTGPRVLAGGTTASIATMMKVGLNGANWEWIFWGHGLT